MEASGDREVPVADGPQVGGEEVSSTGGAGEASELDEQVRALEAAGQWVRGNATGYAPGWRPRNDSSSRMAIIIGRFSASASIVARPAGDAPVIR